MTEILTLVRERSLDPWIFPMVAIAAHIGMRRSEILRSRVDDFDLVGATALVREKKRAKGKLTTRSVPTSPLLAGVLRGWFEDGHSGGPWTITQGAGVARSKRVREGSEAVTVGESNCHLEVGLKGSRWELIGWHSLRRSFASNCVARGVDERLIDGWMGHQTEAMRRRYRHLLPDQHSKAIRDAFPEGG